MALRAATVLTRISNIDALHREAKLLKVEQHPDMIRSQTAPKYANPLHPLRKFVDAPNPLRLMKQTSVHNYNEFIPQCDTLTVPQ